MRLLLIGKCHGSTLHVCVVFYVLMKILLPPPYVLFPLEAGIAT